ncbi:trypsin-like peptidase domain-containing protein [Actinoplanes sp. N902-109]|uniref:trypsin-like peptidase domain-containing protein n=1 Tax=Actinoplanes sp. (strain N902-109) TaxID=649831 RepID=UPI0003294490|nr:trypsin-like peptidase domain-containing protein [Actinoplanes sp. N902-109]AGL18721.1 hypothetical protein L083_5211 [Actinoplanes sp. N902-109]
MSVSLAAEDFERVVAILATMPDFRTAQQRADLLTDVFAGTPRGDDVITSLDLDGTPRAVAVRVVQRLQLFGQDEPGREALGVLLNKMLSYLGGGGSAQVLRSVLVRYPLATPPAVDDTGIGEWRGGDTPSGTAEKIIGENTLRDIFVLELALDAARAVVRVLAPGWVGTGFMVSPRLLVTNHHVLPDRAVAAASSYTFNHQVDRARRARPAEVAGARAEGLFHTDERLDLTVVELETPSAAFQPLVMRARRAGRGQRVTIIQHPGGHYKKISMQNNFVAYADDRVVQYTTSTEPGSSGSPVFDQDFEVIGVHHAGGLLSTPGSTERQLRNEGISTVAILADLARNAPEIAAQLAR